MAHMVTMANGILRQKLGIEPKSRATVGAAFWTKAVLQKALRETSLVKRENKARRKPEFRLDPTRPGELLEIEAA